MFSQQLQKIHHCQINIWAEANLVNSLKRKLYSTISNFPVSMTPSIEIYDIKALITFATELLPHCWCSGWVQKTARLWSWQTGSRWWSTQRWWPTACTPKSSPSERSLTTTFFIKMCLPQILFSFIFVSSNKHHYNFYNKYSPSRILCRDSNPRLSEHESNPITTRPGLSP